MEKMNFNKNKTWVYGEELENPMHPQNRGKKRFETLAKKHPDGSIEKGIWIDGVMLDYSIDISAFREACRMGDLYKAAIQRDIVNHFVNCVEDMVGRRITIKDIQEAQKTGWI